MQEELKQTQQKLIIVEKEYEVNKKTWEKEKESLLSELKEKNKELEFLRGKGNSIEKVVNSAKGKFDNLATEISKRAELTINEKAILEEKNEIESVSLEKNQSEAASLESIE